MEKERLTIAIVTNNYKPYAGGVVNSITSFYHELKQQGHAVTIITLDFLNTPAPYEEDVIHVPCPITFLYKTNHMAIPWRANHYVLQIIKKINPDIIHSQHPFLLGQSALKAAKQLHIPIVFTYHTLYDQYVHYAPMLPAWISQRLVMQTVNTYCALVDGIIAPSSAMHNALTAAHIKNNIRTLPSAIAPVFFELQPISKKRSPSFKLLCVSRFVQEKNLYFLLDLLATLDHRFTLTLVGYGVELSALQHYAYTTLQLHERVLFIVKPSKDELVNLYQQADLFVFASQTDTQALVLAEAMACSTPVVSLNGPGQRDIIKQGINGYLVHSLQEMHHAITAIADDPQLHIALQEGALQTAQHYKPTCITRQLLDFYYDLIAKSTFN